MNAGLPMHPPRGATPFGSLDGADGSLTMSSREIAERTGKEHKNVIRDIRTMLVGLYGADAAEHTVPERRRNRHREFCGQNAGAILDAVMGHGSDRSHHESDPTFPGVRWKRDRRGYVEIFFLDKEHTLTLVSGYDVRLRKAIIDRWIELETAARPAAALPNFADPVAAARAWADAQEARLIAERTKAEIGTRREATAMNTASQAVKKVGRLEIELDRNRQYATIKRMEMLYHGQSFSWRRLKAASADIGIPAIDIFDANYGTVKAYHADAWREAYALEIPDPEAH